jgi:DNA-binding SARP family transcriptional activator
MSTKGVDGSWVPDAAVTRAEPAVPELPGVVLGGMPEEPAPAATPEPGHDLDFRILGPLEVRLRGQAVDLGGPKPRALLAVLLLHAGRVMSADRLIDELWGEAPPKSARHLLHVYVSSLRKALARASAGPLVSRTPGYVLEIEVGSLDAGRFERLLEDGRRLLVAEDAPRAAEALRSALQLWRGPALADFTYAPFAQAEIARLEELRVIGIEERIEAELALGRHVELVGELERLVAEDPLRERPRGQLMLALYRCGRQAEALEAYQTARRVLVDELGIEPGTALQQLQQAILRHDLELEQVVVAAPAAAAVVRPVRAERKLVTILVAGVADDDRLDGLDPEARVEVVERAFAAVAGAIDRHGGVVERSPGEELLGVFGVPSVHEDDALRAVRAAWEARSATESHGGVDVGIRSAVETGEVVIEDAAGGPTSGEPVARAARLCHLARAGEVLIGEKTHRLVRHAVLTDDEPAAGARAGGLAGFRRLRGLVPRAPVFARRFDSRLVGREHELAALRHELDRVSRERGLRLLTLVGDAGIGKTRLCQELVASVRESATVLVGSCLSHGEGGTFRPLREAVEAAAGEATPAAILRLAGDDPESAAIAQRVAAAIGATDAVVTREEAFWAFRRLLEALARRRPLLLVLEDVHWAEPSQLELVEHLADWSRDAPVLVLCLARPDLLEERPEWSDDRANVSRRRLEPLTDDQSGLLVERLVGGAPLPDEVRARIVAAAEGNPLFLEQMLSMLSEEQHAGRAIEFPPTIQVVLAARLDRLGPAERAVVDRASVAGPAFSQAAIAALLPEEGRAFLPRHLRALLERHYFDADAASLPGAETFRFHHALIQEAAYRAVPKRLRAELHERLADWLEHELGERVGGHEATVGFHLEQAFRLREELHAVDWHARRLAERASARLGAAGRAALAGEDTPAAVGLLDRAVALRPPGDARRLELLPDLVLGLRETADVERAAAYVGEAIDGAGAASDAGIEARARIERAHLRLMTDRDGGVAAALAEGELCVASFEEIGDALGLAKAWQLIALAYRLQGRQTARLGALQNALGHARLTGDLRLEGRIRDHMGGIYNYGPPPVEEGIRYVEESLQWARDHGDRVGEADALAHGRGRFGAMVGDFERAREAVAEARAIFADLGLVMFVAGHASAAGFVELHAGDPEAAERELRAGYELVQRAAMRGSYFGMGLREELAQALYVLGRHDEARALSEESERRSASDDLQAQVQWRAVRAKVLAREERVEEAESLARAGVAIAEQTELVLVHANALLDLGEVLQAAGRPEEAGPFLEDARLIFERKGDLVSAARARVASTRRISMPGNARGGGR